MNLCCLPVPGTHCPQLPLAAAMLSATPLHSPTPAPLQTDVNGPGQSPLWAFLKNKQGGLLGSDIKWNCERASNLLDA